MFRIVTDLHREISYSSFIFSGGEVQVKLAPLPIRGESITIEAHLSASDKIMELALLVDALRRTYGAGVPIALRCPYLPYARQDRAMNPGEALSLRVMCDFLNSLRFSQVEVWDAHSDVGLALLNNVKNVEPVTFMQRVAVDKNNTILVSPDAGALKKVAKVASGLGFEMVRADKTRSTKDGSITGTVVYTEHIGDKDFLIVDDICDGGRTFIELAKELRKYTNGKVKLYVTHGIFSKGFEPLFEFIDTIYVACPFPVVADFQARHNFDDFHILNLRGGH